MTELLTAAQMRAIEAAAIDAGEVTGLALMERAGQGVVNAVFARWPELAPAASGGRGPAPSADASPPEYFDQSERSGWRAVVLCGPGNNGGDGFVVARLLRGAGWDVDVFFYGDAAKLPADARVNYERWLAMGEVRPHHSYLSDQLRRGWDLVIDAVFGTGLSRPLAGSAWRFCRQMYRDGIDVSVDVISGFCADSGQFLDAAAASKDDFDGPMGVNLVVTFERAKMGHYLDLLATQTENLVVVPIGIDAFVPSFRRDRSIVSLSKQWVFRAANKYETCLRTSRFTHKYTHGHALVLAGSVSKGGAARLAARGALRIGAGLVTLGVPPAALIENAAQLNAVMLTKIKDVNALAATLADMRINALCVGPGFGMGAREKALLAAVLAEQRPTVLDADALTMLSQEPSLFEALHETCVLTPHAGEFARLFPDISERLAAPAMKGPAYSKVDATRDAAKRAGCVVLLKGPDTVIAAPDGQCCINASVYERAAPWLATAGSGDVLAGFITGLLARGFAPIQAAQAGAWLHTECALLFGPGLIAEDLPEVLPKVLRRLQDDCDNMNAQA